MVSAIALIVNEKGGALERTKVELDTLRPKEVLVKLKATGICHTDLAVKAGHIPMPFPVVLGHEGIFYAQQSLQPHSDEIQSLHTIKALVSC
jgi:aryl-alcohol dehydrogenase